jgi:hypothetical protein
MKESDIFERGIVQNSFFPPYLFIDHGEDLELPLGLLHVFLELRHCLGPFGQHILLDIGCEFYQPLTVIKIVGIAYQKTLLI